MRGATGKRILLRADADSMIGNGHWMRMLALGQAWRDRGGRAMLVTRSSSRSLWDRARREKIEVVELCEGSAEQEIQKLKLLAHSNSVDFIVVDGYQFDTDYQLAMRRISKGLMIVDDCRHLSRYAADLVLNQNIGIEPADYQACAAGAKILAGLSFCLLRREFRKAVPPRIHVTNHRRHQQSLPQKVLVTLGGADPDNISSQAIRAMESLHDLNLNVRLIVGNNNPHRHQLLSFQASNPQLEILFDVEDMASQYRWAELAVVAGGSTNWELCSFEVPRVVIVLAENQRQIAQRLDEAGVAINLGPSHLLSPEKLAEEIRRLICDPNLRQSQTEKCRRLIDGQGAIRVVDEILNFLSSRVIAG